MPCMPSFEYNLNLITSSNSFKYVFKRRQEERKRRGKQDEKEESLSVLRELIFLSFFFISCALRHPQLNIYRSGWRYTCRASKYLICSKSVSSSFIFFPFSFPSFFTYSCVCLFIQSLPGSHSRYWFFISFSHFSQL